MSLALPEGWRGLAHFQLESRRKVLKKCSDERTFNELYILEEFALNIKCISNLPFSKRLEVCKLFKYKQVESNSVVYKVGDLATSLYIIFTGAVKVSTTGKKGHDFYFLRAGDYFGEVALDKGDQLRKETVTAKEKCELVVLSKKDFNGILKNEVTPEIKEKMETLKCVKVLRGISDHSIQRLAKLLIPRTFAKNRVIAFQGDEAMEMFFMRSGECRVVMEVHKEPQYAPRPLPQAALKSCRLPSLSSKVCLSGHAVRSSYMTETQFLPQIATCQQSKYASTLRNWSKHEAFSPIERPSPLLSEYYSSSDEKTHSAYALQPETRNLQTSSRLSFVTMATGNDFESRSSQKGGHGHHRQNLQPLESSRKPTSSYTLKSFLKEFERRGSNEDYIPDLGFSDKHALSWNTGTNLTGMLRGDISDAAVYQAKFENWARRVLARERRLCPKHTIDHEFASFPKDMMWNSWPLRTKKSGTFEDTIFLDVGALHAGDYFGEIGLLHHSQRKASILTVTSVEVLVLSKWDFNRQLDKDIVECLSANNYKKIDYVFRQYQKTCRWTMYKKKVMHEVLAARRHRFPNLYEHDLCRGMACSRLQKRE